MGTFNWLLHLAGFAAPALALALLMPLASRFVLRSRGPRIVTGFWIQAAVGVVAGVTVLAAGLWWFGRDGKMATYGALLVVMASVQWLLARGWRR